MRVRLCFLPQRARLKNKKCGKGNYYALPALSVPVFLVAVLFARHAVALQFEHPVRDDGRDDQPDRGKRDE